MIDEHKEAQASLYALGALPPDERREFESILRTDLRLQFLVSELRGTATVMVAALPRIDPPPELKGRILAALDQRPAASASVLTLDSERAPSWMAWMPWAMAACFAILCVVLISLGNTLRQQAVALNDQLGEKTDEAAALQKQFDLLQARQTRETTNFLERIQVVEREAQKRIEDANRQAGLFTNQFQQRQAESQRQITLYRNQAEQLARDKQALQDALANVGGTSPGNNRAGNARISILRPTDPQSRTIGAALWNAQEQRGLLTLESLPPLPANQSYQLWLIDPAFKTPVSAGVLPPEATGILRLQFNPDIRVDGAERIAISVEPKGGSAAPTGRIVMSSG